MSDFSPDALPNRFDHAEAQPRLFAAWDAAGCFHAVADSKKKPYSIVIPPPNVTGALHLGHALNNTLQDAQIRMKRMQGYNALWMPGTDHAGIATQAVVERRLKEEEGKTRHDLGREKLVERIWAWKAQYEARILDQLKRMGASCDWARTRFTLDDVCARAVRQTFFNLFSKGLIFRGKKLVNWDTFLQTAVSDDEVTQETVKGKFWRFRYPVVNPAKGEPSHVEIATTRPETMLGDTAVAVHPEPAKALARAESEMRDRIAKANAKERPPLESQLEEIVRRKTEMLPALEQLAAMARAGRKLMLPLANREIPLVADEWAKPEMGSGCVKITPAHDPNDYQVGIRQKLPMVNILNPDGTITAIREPDGSVNPATAKYQGLTIPKARQRVVDDLDALGLLGDVEDREIELPHSDRSKTPIEPFLADQWFVKMADLADGRPGLAQSAIDAVTSGRVKIVPERYASSYVDWLKEKRDWPVSRQLWWGHQIPVWVGEFAAVPPALESRLQELAMGRGQDFAFAIDVDPARQQPDPTGQPTGGTFVQVCLTPEADDLAPELERAGLKREEDVLDTWFSSALWPHSTLGWPDNTPELATFYPTSVLITSRDIITLWVARMVLTGLNNLGEIPFREVFIHPKILDGYGETMSKSKGNGVDPLDVIDKFGADALRFGLAQLTTDTQDVRMPVQFECPACQALLDQTKENRTKTRIKCAKCGSEFSTQWASKPEDVALPRGPVVSERFEVARNFTNKLWNAARFAMINLEGYVPGKIDVAALTVEDRWILSRLSTVTQRTTDALEKYRYAEACKTLYDFAWDEFCSFYVEMAKPRLQDPATRSHAQRVLAHTLDTILRLLHPLIPFVTEEIWGLLAKCAPARGMPEPSAAEPLLIAAKWPQAEASWQDATIETRFGRFQEVLAAIRETRNRQNIANRQAIEFCVRCDAATAELLKPMAPYFTAMANAQATGWGADAKPSPTNAKTDVSGMEVFVDLAGFLDVDAELAKNAQLEQKLLGVISSKEGKLKNESFVARAPANVVQLERDALTQAQSQLASVRETIAALKASKK